MEHEPLAELTLLIAERAHRLSSQRPPWPGGELELWLEAEAQVKRELSCRRAAGPMQADPPRL